MSENDPVLVAVDGSERSAAALRYAATEARRVRADLRIVHVVPEFLSVAGPYPTPLVAPADLEAEGARILEAARTTAEQLVAADHVTAMLATGDRAAAILAMAARARIVVMGAGCASLLEHLVVGSTLNRVAGSSTVPVVAVPSDWAACRPGRPIVVAFKHCDAASPALIEAALERATAEQTTLKLVHVSDIPPAYAHIVGAAADLESWAQAVDRRIRTDSKDALARHAGVEVEVLVRYGQPAAVLQELSEDASLLVMVRPVHAFPAGLHLGSTGRALLRESRCPVEIVPTPALDSRDHTIDRHRVEGETVPSGLIRRVEDLITEGTA
ncbi:universal stress protein [Nocardioides nematodiphilus]|uniref:universal stress protein n=1 Tax=Nocardioides nematodiphilus TaxID=2849669 RepID=UPI001CD98FD1|nr:universal stress protein [Nocardioides nematodiphilus]MCA1984758.1 universal stress protein [Nocardioides nematodiphilus]